MLQITLDSVGRQSSMQSVNSQSWDFKLRVVNDGDSTELRISFDENEEQNNSNSIGDILPLEGFSDQVME